MTGAWIVLIVPLLAAAAWSDVASRTIPNWIGGGILAAYVPVALLVVGPAGLGLGLLSGLVMGIVGTALFASGLVGGGDVKLLAAVAAWTGPAGVPELLLATTLAGGVIALLILAARGLSPRRSPDGSAPRPERGVPYGVAIAIGALWAGLDVSSLARSA